MVVFQKSFTDLCFCIPVYVKRRSGTRLHSYVQERRLFYTKPTAEKNLKFSKRVVFK